MTNHEVIILALETIRDASYSIERRKQCQGLIKEMKMLREKAIESGQYCVKADQGTYIICLEADGTVTKTPIVAWKICAPEITGMSPPRVAEPVTVHFENHETDWVNDCDWAYEFPCGVVSSPNDRDFGSAEIWLSYVKSKKG